MIRHFKLASLLLSAALLCLGLSVAHAAEQSINLTIRDGQITPATIEVASGVPVVLEIVNLGAQPERLRSRVLRERQPIAPGERVVFHTRPLPPGRYALFAPHNPQAGEIIVVVK